MITTPFFKYLTKVGVLSVVEVYAARSIFKDDLPPWVAKHIIGLSIVLNLIVFFIDGVLIYPRYREPLRHLPTIKQGRQDMGIVMEHPRGATPLRWINAFPGADMIRIRGLFNSTLLVRSPRALRDVLNTRTYDFEKPWGVRAFLARVIGFGLILSEGAAHKKQRKALTPAFHIRSIRELYSLMWERTGIFLEQVELDLKKHPAAQSGEKGVVGYTEMSEWASRLTLDVIGPTALGKDFGALTTEEDVIAQTFLEVLEPSKSRLAFLGAHFIVPEWIVRRLPLATNAMLNKNEKILRGICDDIVKEKRQLLFSNEKPPNAEKLDILSRIMLTNEFNDSELVDQMLTFLAAGHETTASALTWTCYLLARHPEVQEKLRAEIRSTIPSPSAPITHDILESMPYLNGVCEEVQRLYPTVPATIREAVRDTMVADTPVPASTMLLLVPYATNRSTEAWGPNANDLVPERWIDTLPDGTRRPNKNGGADSNFCEITFLHGPRACIGRDFAKAELRCAVAGVAGRFGIELRYPEKEAVASGVITTKPAEGMDLRLRVLEGW